MIRQLFAKTPGVFELILLHRDLHKSFHRKDDTFRKRKRPVTKGNERHNRSVKRLSIQHTRPFIDTCTPASSRRPVKVSLVNWLPWSVLKISGLP